LFEGGRVLWALNPLSLIFMNNSQWGYILKDDVSNLKIADKKPRVKFTVKKVTNESKDDDGRKITGFSGSKNKSAD